MSLNCLMIGATGLVGGLALPALSARVRESDSGLWLPGRRAPEHMPEGARTLLGTIDEGRVSRWLNTELRGRNQRLDVFVSALGTTIKQAGSRPAFRNVDFELVRQMADVARHFGATRAVLVSSVGADPQSGNFYLRTKGELEAEIESLGFKRCDFLQPGLLLGARPGSNRLAEGLGQRVLPALNPLLIGRLQAYRSVPAEAVARALVAACLIETPGVYRHTYREIMNLAARRDT
ncbi:hypothetical protein C7S18_02320 [Ahniella affigens]|uniref:Nucleoside-diphosphate sugar epimerase n=1 Tax=Ahniella affigens TaxID=2021234 RepID=A0A2P1PMP0_9GAMM|nr:hypothetical protein [Ahniella affigens]AVP96099.1 hypothetical protein C7S18_02320 [Ahniella affigens]